jgi:hypothetical protein
MRYLSSSHYIQKSDGCKWLLAEDSNSAKTNFETQRCQRQRLSEAALSMQVVGRTHHGSPSENENQKDLDSSIKTRINGFDATRV